MTAAWPILPDATTSTVAVVTRSASGKIFTSGLTARGILRPFRRDNKLDFANGGGAELIASNVGQVLGTICSSDYSSGELPWRTEFGSLMHVLRLRNNSAALADQARVFVARAIERWEPRALVRRVRVQRPGEVAEQDRLLIFVSWDIVNGVDRSLVIVPGLETEIAVG